MDYIYQLQRVRITFSVQDFSLFKWTTTTNSERVVKLSSLCRILLFLRDYVYQLQRIEFIFREPFRGNERESQNKYYNFLISYSHEPLQGHGHEPENCTIYETHQLSHSSNRLRAIVFEQCAKHAKCIRGLFIEQPFDESDFRRISLLPSKICNFNHSLDFLLHQCFMMNNLLKQYRQAKRGPQMG